MKHYGLCATRDCGAVAKLRQLANRLHEATDEHAFYKVPIATCYHTPIAEAVTQPHTHHTLATTKQVSLNFDDCPSENTKVFVYCAYKRGAGPKISIFAVCRGVDGFVDFLIKNDMFSFATAATLARTMALKAREGGVVRLAKLTVESLPGSLLRVGYTKPEAGQVIYERGRLCRRR